MRKLTLGAIAGLTLLFVQPGLGQAHQWVPGNPYFIYNLRGYSYGSGTPLPFSVPASGFHRILYWDGVYDPISGLYYGAVSGYSSRQGHYSGRVIARPTPKGTYYHYIPSKLGTGRVRQLPGRNISG